MKKFRPLFLLLACLLAVILAVVFGGGNEPVAQSAGSPPEPAVLVEESAEPDLIPMPGAVVEAPVAEVAAVEEVVSQAPKDWVKRTIFEEWTDGPEKLAGRQRVRIVEADFKYPNLRLEEAVTTDPETGLETVKLIHASVADHLMLGLKKGADPELAADAIRKMGYEVRAIEPGSYILAELPMFDAAKDQNRAAADLASLEEFINHAEPDYLVFPCITPNDPAYSQGNLWGLHNPGTSADSSLDADIDAPEGWDIRKDAPGIVVAVTDTGIQYNHEDLAPNMWTHPTNGSHGFDAYENDNNPMDVGGHGTHCAGTIGARGGNAKGLTGVAWDVKLMAVRFLGPNGGSTSDAIRSVNYARQNGARVISASWGGGGYSQSLYDAIKACGDAGIPFVAAAGNSTDNNDATPHYPSSYKLDNIVSVASTTKKDTLSSFSCYGRTSVDIAAPGSSIWSSFIGSNTAYTYLNGTSMATPHVSGALALAIAHFPTEDMHSIIARLYGSVDKLPALAGRVATGGRLNLARLLGGSPPNVFNDDFADAHRFTEVYGTWVGTNARATREPDEDSFAGPGIGNKSLWLAFRTPHAGLVSLDITSEILGFEIIVFEGGEKGQLKRVAHSDRLGSFYRFIRFNAKADTEYRVVLDTYIVPDQRWRVDYELAPPNDYFVDATPLSGDSFAVSGYNRGATGEIFEKAKPHAGTGQGKSVWWNWTAPESGNFIINTSGSAFDTVLAVYTGTNANSLVNVASNEDRSPLDWTSQVTIPAVAGTTYHIAVDSFRDDSEGEIKLNGFRSGMLSIIRQPAGLSVELGKRAVFDVSVLSDGDVSYQWFLNSKAIPGQTSANLVIDPVRAEDFGNYKVQVSNTENLVNSSIAALSEKQTAPQLAWSSGNQAVASGTAVTLAAEFSGSVPMSYAWTKNGQPIAGSASSLTFASALVANAGAYRLTATNTAGSATADFSLTVIASPWERWEWRRPGIPNAAITDIKVYGTEAFAVAGTVLFRSTDGESWRKSVFPQGFTAKMISKIGNLFVCLGFDADNQFRIATSTNNATAWAISAPTGFAAPFEPEKYLLEPHGTTFIAYHPSGQDFFRSTNGVSWTRLTATNLGGQTMNLAGNGRIATNGSTFILASKSMGANDRMRFFKSTNGIAWTEHETNVVGTNSQANAYYALGKFHLYDTHHICTSTDGVNWTPHVTLNNGFGSGSLFASNGNTLMAFEEGTQMVRYYTEADVPYSRTLHPTNSHSFTAAASFGNKVLYGTDRGLLALARDALDVRIPKEKSSTLQSIEFTENLFIARTTNPSYTTNALSDQVSGDGATWKESALLDSFTTIPIGHAFGRYWGHRSSLETTHAGYNPFDARLNPNEDIGLLRKVYFVGELPDGSALAANMGSLGSIFNPQIQIHTRDPGAATWTPATFPLALYPSSRFVSLGNRWYSNIGSATEFGGATSALIYTSINGKSWASTGLTGSNPHFIAFGGKSWCFFQTSASPYPTTAAHSTNGTSWTTVAVTGIPSNSKRNFAKRVVFFGGYLVLLGGDENLYYSENGTTWLRGFTPDKVVDIAVGNGQLVAVMKNGGIIQTGSAHPGVSAPLVSITSPQTASTHLIGSRILIEGTVSDPEDGAASYDCYLDDKLVASGTGKAFRFHVTTSDLNGHTVTVRARDAHGLRQIDSIRLRVALPDPENLLANREGGSHIPHAFATTFDGVFYVVGTRTVYRSVDGRTWENVPLPSFTNAISGIASGNGALVIQFDNGGIITTRDGINWTHFLPNHTTYRVSEPIRFSSGLFIAAYTSESGGGSVMTSEDGLRWATGAAGYQNLSPDWTANNHTGTIIGRDRTFGVSRTFDQGYNWFPIPAIPTTFFQGTHGIYADGKFIVAITDSMSGYRKLFVSGSEDASAWQQHPLPAGIQHSPFLGHHGGLFFLGQLTDYSFVSSNGTTWQPMSHAVHRQRIAYSRGLFVAQASAGGMVSSRDGINWSPIPIEGMPATVSKVLSNEDTFLVVDSGGGTWTSPDGADWRGHLPGATVNTSTSVGRSLAEINGTLVVAGARLFVASSDNGRSWTNVTVNGQPPSTVNTYHKVVSSASEILALEGFPSAANTLHRSIDGIAFTTVTGLPAKTWDGLASNGTEWMLLARDGSLFRSNDGGLTWTQVPTTGMVRGGAVEWFNGRWIIIGTETSSGSSPYIGYTLGEGDVIQKHGNVFPTSSQLLQTLAAHGKMIVWQSGRSPIISGDGVTWLTSDLWPGGSSPSYDIYSTSEGFAAFGGTSFEATTPGIWIAGKDGVAWRQIPAPFKGFSFAENLGERVFLFSSGYIAELHDKDLALTLPSLPAITRGVGDVITANVTITNFGRAIPSVGKWKVTAWLSKNRFFGDGKNVPLGTFEITAAMPAPGASQSYPLKFTIPNEIPTGNSFLILSLTGPGAVVETNTANNTVISDNAAINIPEWEFAVATNGNGQVNRDFAATRYPHKAQVSLTASAGKGATFTGWGGDALSPNDQITILMDGNKSVQANFANRATLQVFVNGMGEVTGLLDFGSYPVTATAAITAVPAPGWAFSHWSGASTVLTPAASIPMNVSKAVTANFILPVATWKSSKFNAQQLANPAISGDQMDPDSDGILNWMEYLHGSNPMDNSSRGSTPFTIENEFLSCVYTRNTGPAGGASLTCEAGRDLSGWASPDLQERILSTVDGIETVEARLPVAGQGMGFLRFRYNPPQP